MKRIIVFFDGTLYGFLLEDEDYGKLGGRLLARAFRDRHVQLVYAPDGKLDIVDDINSDSYRFVHDVRITMLPCEEPWKGEPWEISAEQKSGIQDELAEAQAEVSA